MDESYANIPTSHLPGSVPAVISEEKKTPSDEDSEANMQIFPPNNGGGGGQGYQPLGNANGLEQQSANNWKGVFSISSYTQYFNVDTDIVLNRLMSSLDPINADFFSKIDANPDLYGLVWITTTLVFVIASLGNCATYLMHKHSDSSTSWSFDVSYINLAAGSIYGYALVVPMGFYFLLQYVGSNSSLIRFWCMWGYSLFIFILSSVLLVIPVEFIRWLIILVSGVASATFVASNLRSYIEGRDLTVVLVAAFVLQMGLALFIKMWFFA
ncbi:uncharacterized protein LOC127803561 [Diospyros lotus]|uniref:uncharacterized protein LOC127803561 n=1 Tax=Diospyros lotus TaxID=55363 RepID=UPI0022583E31|nr:uncharacterized protein LOC127803561 [Diospyros lotus]